ncbi:class II fructose-bisphosphate aldolase [Buchananella hordeovulneris]|uniref:Fructose-bisphosphate aldolase n=1 Tax=Buchananella hordeovulneris TaxID=52770 RepID=A0A1Q5PTT4_9ACTO|nr:class II fructose-bisphosphate aldolase [Buchananella hordeovulneris]MDO5081533.1 class II fructose-bisphosphate aldolase family protein [Buchananella hordeovulneris]OKL50936.1 fructose-bisphosphate aldolase [Buchananella hordeovulneris]RRD44142.1 class II fructose-bisphosphate aldolase [Buchananella hordeovulneris]RRD51726.1 class II fructose-bisphosphate aldolase [Buchananella hordeovulneris]
MFASTAQLAAQAASEGHGLGAFNVVLLDHAEAFVAAAEEVGAPVVLQISENAVKYHGALEPLAQAVLALARRAAVPVAVHLDHAESVELCRQAVALGFSSVMYDGSKLSWEDNVATTAEVVRLCHSGPQGRVDVEAELGEVGGKNGVHDPSARTDPQDAARFVAATGVDLLAVAVGSSHAMTTRGAQLDNALIGQIAAAVPVPLVLHGSSGVSDDGMVAAIKAGMTKINVSTHLNKLFTAAVREFLAAEPNVVDPRKYFRVGNAVIQAEVARLLRLYRPS